MEGGGCVEGAWFAAEGSTLFFSFWSSHPGICTLLREKSLFCTLWICQGYSWLASSRQEAHQQPLLSKEVPAWDRR
jgi:hypothetical protein